MIENLRSHPYSRTVCLQTARKFEREAAKHLADAQWFADRGDHAGARETQSNARLAQPRASAWRLRAKNA
jgi:hypothetical protein